MIAVAVIAVVLGLRVGFQRWFASLGSENRMGYEYLIYSGSALILAIIFVGEIVCRRWSKYPFVLFMILTIIYLIIVC